MLALTDKTQAENKKKKEVGVNEEWKAAFSLVFEFERKHVQKLSLECILRKCQWQRLSM